MRQWVTPLALYVTPEAILPSRPRWEVPLVCGGWAPPQSLISPWRVLAFKLSAHLGNHVVVGCRRVGCYVPREGHWLSAQREE